jgi:hypothetical protein
MPWVPCSSIRNMVCRWCHESGPDECRVCRACALLYDHMRHPNDITVVRRSRVRHGKSHVHAGRGLFAVQDVSIGEFIATFGGVETDKAPQGAAASHTFAIGRSGRFMDGKPPPARQRLPRGWQLGVAQFVQRCDLRFQQNARFVYDHINSRLRLKAVKNIPADDEIFPTYGRQIEKRATATPKSQLVMAQRKRAKYRVL